MKNKLKFLASAFIPAMLILLLLIVFLKFGPLGVFKSTFPPVEKIFIQRVAFSPEKITVHVMNDGPEPVTIAQVLINDAYWQFEMTPSQTLKPLQRGQITVHYPWVDGDAEKIALLSSTGVLFEKEIEIASITPQFNWLYFKTFVLLGIYVGVIPILLGLLWLPFVRNLKEKWFNFLLSMTIGLLVFLGFDALAEAIELAGTLPSVFNSVGIIIIGFFLAVLTLSAVSHVTVGQSKDKSQKGQVRNALMWSYFIALGIGLHNLGEGLAIGSAYAIGEIALGSLLVVGFMVHNVTEGVAIISPLSRHISSIKNIIIHLILMGIIAGGPTILGTIIGGFNYFAPVAVFFLALGSGAIFEVVHDIIAQMLNGTGTARKTSAGAAGTTTATGQISEGDSAEIIGNAESYKSFFTFTNVLGFVTGLLIMYATGFLVF